MLIAPSHGGVKGDGRGLHPARGHRAASAAPAVTTRAVPVAVMIAPLGPVVDTRLLLGIVDQIVLVAEWGRTPRQLVSYTLENEPQLRSKMLGVVLSRVNVKDLQSYSAVDLQPGYESYYGSQAPQRS